jgi:phage baseplate assembly protein W
MSTTDTNVAALVDLASWPTQTVSTLDQILIDKSVVGDYVYSDFNYRLMSVQTIEHSFPLEGGTLPSATPIPVSAFNPIVNYDAIKGSVYNLIYTLPEERVMEPGIGINPRNMLFTMSTDAAISRLSYRLSSTLKAYDPRLSVQNITITRKQGDEIDILVNVGIEGIAKSVPILILNARSRF